MGAKKSKPIKNNYIIKDNLGSNSFGNVHLVADKSKKNSL